VNFLGIAEFQGGAPAAFRRCSNSGRLERCLSTPIGFEQSELPGDLEAFSAEIIEEGEESPAQPT